MFDKTETKYSIVDGIVILKFGRHKGEPISRIPVDYLLWMIQVEHDMADKAKEELERRGTVTDIKVGISNHAIDRASLRFETTWKSADKGEGIYTWLHRVTVETLEKFQEIHGKEVVPTKLNRGNMIFLFRTDGKWPTLTTVVRRGKRRKS